MKKYISNVSGVCFNDTVEAGTDVQAQDSIVEIILQKGEVYDLNEKNDYIATLSACGYIVEQPEDKAPKKKVVDIDPAANQQ